MTINITSRGTSVKDSFREILEKKIAKLDRFFNDDARAEVMVTNQNGRETVEITIHSTGMVFRSERTSQDRLDSLDAVMDTLSRQIVKNKSKLKSKMRKGVSDFEKTFDYVANDDEEDEYKIVRQKQFALKPMTADEAILQMNMLGHSFFMYRSSETEEVSVVYKRNDGNYGLIEPIAEE